MVFKGASAWLPDQSYKVWGDMYVCIQIGPEQGLKIHIDKKNLRLWEKQLGAQMNV